MKKIINFFCYQLPYKITVWFYTKLVPWFYKVFLKADCRVDQEYEYNMANGSLNRIHRIDLYYQKPIKIKKFVVHLVPRTVE